MSAEPLVTALAGYRRIRDRATGLAEADLDRPTGLAGWCVRDLLSHVAWGSAMEADALRRAARGDSTTAEADSIPRSAPLSEHLAALDRGLEALADATEHTGAGETLVPLPAGTVPLGFAGPLFAMEAGVHDLDLATALGEESSLTADEVAACVAIVTPVTQVLGSLGRRPGGQLGVRLAGETFDLRLAWNGTAWEEAEPPAASSSLEVSGPDEAVLLFLYGRTGAEDPRLRVRDVDGLAGRFKEYFPGP